MNWDVLGDETLATAKQRGDSAVREDHVAIAIAARLHRGGVEVDAQALQHVEDRATRACIPGDVSAIPSDVQAVIDRIHKDDDAFSEFERIADPAPTPAPTAATATTPPPSSTEPSGSTANPNPPATGAPFDLDAVLAELDELVGLTEVKAKVRQLIAVQQLNAVRTKQNLPALGAGLNLVFTGPPGTGKTTVARLVGRIYHALGELPESRTVEVSAADLIAGYVGQTAIKTHDVIVKADGGVLFIDEAYALTGTAGNEFGPEAIATLVKEMEDRRSTLAVIVAGYAKEMDLFVHSNPGLESRFQTVVTFPSYTPAELVRIFQSMCSQQAVTADAGVADSVGAYLAKVDTTAGNGRLVRNLFGDMASRMAVRAAADGTIDDVESRAFVPDDVPPPPAADARVGFSR